eukprot:766409-Hanusia_phi.AAC.3
MESLLLSSWSEASEERLEIALRLGRLAKLMGGIAGEPGAVATSSRTRGCGGGRACPAPPPAEAPAATAPARSAEQWSGSRRRSRGSRGDTPSPWMSPRPARSAPRPGARQWRQSPAARPRSRRPPWPPSCGRRAHATPSARPPASSSLTAPPSPPALGRSSSSFSLHTGLLG